MDQSSEEGDQTAGDARGQEPGRPDVVRWSAPPITAGEMKAMPPAKNNTDPVKYQPWSC
jgi:hypothetical protein